MVQTLMTTRTKGRNRKSSVSIFSSKVKCGDCGSWYGPKVWHSNDAYRKVIRTLNEETRSGKPFFAHVMTVSNHRPFTYPAGRIRIPNDSKSRAGGVLYSDYSLGQFFAEAARQPWFENTIFLVTADHCASSAGRTEIPLNKYHIPALIYAPGFVEPQHVGGIVSQIDLMPTLLSLLNMSYDSHFYGRSIYDEGYVNRAFIATYQLSLIHISEPTRH